LKLGFYSGEEDMEFSSFSSGTASAVKTWQASLGVREDGVMTAELLQRLFMDEDVETDKDEASTMKKEVKTETTNYSSENLFYSMARF
jgi:peptidoglycan hydrolase-like protein with peptidoglycan-binding domain